MSISLLVLVIFIIDQSIYRDIYSAIRWEIWQAWCYFPWKWLKYVFMRFLFSIVSFARTNADICLKWRMQMLFWNLYFSYYWLLERTRRGDTLRFCLFAVRYSFEMTSCFCNLITFKFLCITIVQVVRCWKL